MFIRFFRQGFSNLVFWWRRQKAIKKLQVNKSIIMEEITGCYQAIGKLVYQQRAGLHAVQAECDKLSRQIAKLETGVLAIEQDILTQKDEPYPDLLGQKQLSFATSTDAKIICTKCKTLLPQNAWYCGNCGVQLKDDLSDLSQPADSAD